MVGFCISDDEACCEASKNEIIRRYYAATNKLAAGACNEAEISKIQMLFKQANITTAYRKVTVAAKEHKKETGHTSAAIELEDGTIICGHSSELLYRLENEYNAKCRWEPVHLHKACWIEADDEKELENFKKRKYQYMAKDIEGRDVFLADSGYVLSMAQQDFEHIKFHFTSEF